MEMQIRAQHPYNLQRDDDDYRDVFQEIPENLILPGDASLRKYIQKILDQGQHGACPGFMASAIDSARMVKLGQPYVELSGYEAYFNEVGARNIYRDPGSTIRIAMKTANKKGICPVTDYPDTDAQFGKTPTAQALKDGLNYRIPGYKRVTSLHGIKAAIAAGMTT